MNSERRHRVLELRQNVSSLDPVELLLHTSNTHLPPEEVGGHILRSAALAAIAQQEIQDIPERQSDLAMFKMLEEQLLIRHNDMQR